MSEGFGWWQAADGAWYPPEQHPDHRPDVPGTYGWWIAADGNSYPPSQHPDYRSPAAAAPATIPPPPGSSPPPAQGFVPQTEPAASPFTPAVIGILVAALLIVIGSVLPWASIDLGGFSDSVGGLDGDGGITLVLGLIIGGLGFASKGRKKGFAIGAIVAAALCALIAIIDIDDVSSTFDGLGIDSGVSVGIGLWIILVASIAAIGAGVKIILDSRS